MGGNQPVPGALRRRGGPHGVADGRRSVGVRTLLRRAEPDRGDAAGHVGRCHRDGVSPGQLGLRDARPRNIEGRVVDHRQGGARARRGGDRRRPRVSLPGGHERGRARRAAVLPGDRRVRRVRPARRPDRRVRRPARGADRARPHLLADRDPGCTHRGRAPGGVRHVDRHVDLQCRPSDGVRGGPGLDLLAIRLRLDARLPARLLRPVARGVGRDPARAARSEPAERFVRRVRRRPRGVRPCPLRCPRRAPRCRASSPSRR